MPARMKANVNFSDASVDWFSSVRIDRMISPSDAVDLVAPVTAFWVSGGSPTRFHSGVILSKIVQFGSSCGAQVMTSYFNNCNVTVDNSNHKNCSIVFHVQLCPPPLWKRFRHPCTGNTGNCDKIFENFGGNFEAQFQKLLKRLSGQDMPKLIEEWFETT